MTVRRQTEIAVVGGGVVGLATALRLAQEGREVTLIAAETPGAASTGNAGVIADYAVMPIGTPELLRQLPALLFARTSPLAIRPAALPALAPWLARFARQSLPAAASRNARAIAALLAQAPASWRALAAEIDGTALLRRNGALYLYDTAAAARGADAALAAQRALGVNVERIGAAQLGQLEPALPEMPEGAAFFPDAMALRDPTRMLAHLDAAVTAAGVIRLTARVARLARGGGVQLEGDGLALRAARVVIAAGAWSRPLARDAGDRIPLETERGYHLEYDLDNVPLSRPTTPASRGFYFTPMEGRLRAAGTVELGGLDAPPSPARIALIRAGARAVFADLPAPARSWMGFRPSLPDSVPVIGASRGGDEVLMAFGHGHLGLTLAPVTAGLIADLVAGRAPPLALAPYSPRRF